MGMSPILSIIHTIIFDTMLNFNGCNNEDIAKTLHVNKPLGLSRFY